MEENIIDELLYYEFKGLFGSKKDLKPLPDYKRTREFAYFADDEKNPNEL